MKTPRFRHTPAGRLPRRSILPVALVLIGLSLSSCAWFRRGGREESRLRESTTEFTPAPAPVPEAEPVRPATQPAPPDRPRGLTPASDVLQIIYFDFDRSEIRPDQLARIDHNLRYLLDHPEARVLIIGHCDERGTTEYNFALGERRAQEVARYFLRNGVANDRIQVLSKGEEEPADPGHNEEAWAKNRRAEFMFFN